MNHSKSSLAPSLSDQRQPNDLTPTVTSAELSADGGGVDLVRDSEGRPSLLHLEGDECRIQRRIEIGKRAFVPAEVRPSVFRAITWPSGCRPYGSTHKLFREIFNLLSRVTPLGEPVVTLIVFFVLASWFVDVLPVAPLLWVVIPPTASGAGLRQVLRLLCRRALPIGDLTVANLRSLPMELRPTIMTDISTFTSGLTRAFRCSSRPNTYTPIGGDVVDLFCSKIVFANQPLHDPAIEFPLEIALAPTLETAQPLTSQEEILISDELVPKLLMYRLQNHPLVRPSKIDVQELTGPTQELARTLAACVTGDDDLRSRIIPLLKPQDEEIQADRQLLPESIALQALLTESHRPKNTMLPVIELTKEVNSILKWRGETRRVTPESVGWVLRRLGLLTVPMADGRKGLDLSNQTRAKIRKLAGNYGVQLSERPKDPENTPTRKPGGTGSI